MINKIKQKIQEGFTLVEILIVVVIVGILAAIAIPTYFNYVEKAYASDAQTQIKTLLEECKILAVTRPGVNKTLVSRIPIAGIEKKIEILDVDTPNISSTKVRQLIREGLSLEGIVPQKVIEYINERRLYTR